MTTDVPGYTYGDAGLARSPVSLDDLMLLRKTVMWSEDDERALRMAGDVLADQVEDILDLWYGFVGSNPHLAAYFAPEGGKPDDRYLQRVRPRFAQWVLDTCRRPYDQAWLDCQHEIALRHTSAKKNQRPGRGSRSDPAPVPGRVHLPDRPDHPLVPRQEGPRRAGRRADAPGVDQGSDPARHAVEPAVREGRVVTVHRVR